jgi:hypothetical protein
MRRLAAVIAIIFVLTACSNSGNDHIELSYDPPEDTSLCGHDVLWRDCEDYITVKNDKICVLITEVDLNSRLLYDEDIIPLERMVNLEALCLRWNQISDLTPLSGLTNLTVLSLYENQISDLTPIAGLTSLERLYLGGNNISDLTQFAAMTHLKYLDINRNPYIQEDERFYVVSSALKNALPDCEIYW